MSTIEAPAATAFRVHAIPPATLAEIRLAGRDQCGNELRSFTDADGGSPLRCCLRRSTAGERVSLIAYRPFAEPGPFAETGPVFVHASACQGYADNDLYPDGFRDWPPMIFRPYRHDGDLDCDMIAYEAIKMGDGVVAESLIASMFSDPTINFIHTRNVNAGCFMFTITRPEE